MSPPPATRRRCASSTRRNGPEELLDLSDLRSPELEEPRARGRAGRARGARRARPRAAAGAPAHLRPRLPRGEGPRVGARLRGPAAAGARAPAREPRDPRARELALPLDHGRRVPGHEPAAVRAGRPARPGGGRDLLRRRRVPVDLPLPARGRRGLPRAARPGRRRARPDPELPLAARGARRDQPPLRGRLRRHVPAARGRGPLPGSRLRAGGRAARDRQGELRGDRRPLAQGRGAHIARACATWSTPARRRRARSSCSSRGTDARIYEEELRALGLPTFRATGRDYYHQQQVVDLLNYLRLLHNRYDDEALLGVLASPFVGSQREERGGSACCVAFVGVSNDGLVLLRRAAPKRPLFVGLEKGIPEGVSERDARLFQAFKQRFDRLAARRRRCRSSGSASGSSPSTTTTSPCSRSGTAAAATRTCASSRGWRAPTRSCAGPTCRASCASSPSRTRSAPPSSRRSPRRRAPT